MDTMGRTSVVVPDKKTSSASYKSVREKKHSSNGIFLS